MFIVNELQNVLPYSFDMEIPQVWMMHWNFVVLKSDFLFFSFFFFWLTVRGVRVNLRMSRLFSSQSGQRSAIHAWIRRFTRDFSIVDL